MSQVEESYTEETEYLMGVINSAARSGDKVRAQISLDKLNNQIEVEKKYTGFSFARNINIKMVVPNKFIDASLEASTGKPFYFKWTRCDFYASLYPDGTVLINYGDFSMNVIEVENRYISSNRGEFGWRFNKNWATPIIKEITSVKQDSFNSKFGYPVTTMKLSSKHEEVQITYQSLFDIIGSVGGFLSILAWSTCIIAPFNRYKMLVYYYNKFHLRSLSAKKLSKETKKEMRKKLLTGSFLEYIERGLRSCICPFKKKKVVDLTEFEDSIFKEIDLAKILLRTREFKAFQGMNLEENEKE